MKLERLADGAGNSVESMIRIELQWSKYRSLRDVTVQYRVHSLILADGGWHQGSSWLSRFGYGCQD